MTSQQPTAFVPGEPLTITISTTPTEFTTTYAVADQCPTGWTVFNISHSGEWDAVNGQVKWGPFLDVQPRALSYQVTPPLTASAMARFVGVSSLDGSSVAIPGAREVTPGCRLSVPSPAAPGQFRLALAGPLGARVVVEASADLVDWVRIAELTNHAGRVDFLDPDSAAYPQRFYRSRLVQ